MRNLYTMLVMVFLLSATFLFSATINVNPGDDLIAAMNSAGAGDSVVVANGTYVLASTLYMSKDNLSLIGESQAGVILDVSGHTGYGIRTTADGLTLKNFTVIPQSASGNAYPIKASFSGGPQSGLVLANITVDGSYRTAVDIHGISGVTVTNVTAKNSSWGNGITFTGVHNATMTGCTTSGNAWGGVAVYCSKPAYVNRGSDNITIDFNANNIGETVYVEDQFGLTNTNISVPGATHLIDNDYAADSFMHMYTNKGEADALIIGNALNGKYGNTKSTVKELATGNFIVDPNLKIQEAINAAAAGKTVILKAGTFVENFTINKWVNIQGDDNVTTIIDGQIDVTAGGQDDNNRLVVRDLGVQINNNNGIGFEITPNSHVGYFTLQDVKVTGIGNLVGESAGVWVRYDASLTDAVINDCYFGGMSYGLYTQKKNGGSGVVNNLYVVDTYFKGNTGKGVYAEKMSNSSFKECRFEGNGDKNYWHANWNAGIDINLKYGAYQDIVIHDNRFTGNGVCSGEGVGLTVKARDDGGYGANPASLNGVTITHNYFDGNERSIRIGEPGKNNAGPSNVEIAFNDFMGTAGCSTGGSPIADVLNYTQSDLTANANYWGTPAGPSPDQIVESPGLVQVINWLDEESGSGIFQDPAKLVVTVWNDANENGAIDAGEKGLQGVEVRIPKGGKVSKHLTNAQGKAVFKNLLPDTFIVRVETSKLPAGVTCTNGDFERELIVSSSNNYPQLVFGVTGDGLDDWTGNAPNEEPGSPQETVEPNQLIFVEGSPASGFGKDPMGWDNAVDKDVEGFDGTVWASKDSAGNAPWAIFEFYDQNVYKFDYVKFQTDNGTDDNTTGNDAYQVRKIQVLVSTTGKADDDFSVVGTWDRRYGTDKLQWCKVGEMVEARFVKLRLLEPVADGKKTQIVEFALDTSDKTGPVAASDENAVAAVPTEEQLLNNYPNPFNPTTTISYRLKDASKVSLRVFDLTGKQVAELVNGHQTAGQYSVQFDAANLPSGVYFYQIKTNSFTAMKRMLLVK